eukprot:gene7301-371_t
MANTLNIGVVNPLQSRTKCTAATTLDTGVESRCKAVPKYRKAATTLRSKSRNGKHPACWGRKATAKQGQMWKNGNTLNIEVEKPLQAGPSCAEPKCRKTANKAGSKCQKTADTLNIGDCKSGLMANSEHPDHRDREAAAKANAENGRHAEYRGRKASVKQSQTAEKTAHTQNIGANGKLPEYRGPKSRCKARRNAGNRQPPSKTTNTLNIGVGESLQSSRARKGLMLKNGGHAEYRVEKPL